MSFLKDIVKEIDNEYATLVSDGVAAGDTSGYIDTGSYVFNALVSGSMVESLETRSLLSLVNRLLVKLSFALALFNISLRVILMQA